MTPQDPFTLLSDPRPPSGSRLFEAVQKDQAHIGGPGGSRSRGARLLLSVAATFAVFALLSSRQIMAGGISALGVAAVVCLLAVGLLLDLLLPGPQSLWPEGPAAERGPKRAVQRIGVAGRRSALTALLLAVFGFFAIVAEPFVANVAAPAFAEKALGCALHGSFRGLLALGLLLGIWQKSDPFSPRLTGGLIGAAAGLVGVAGATLACGNHEGWHLMFGHALVVSLLGALGLLVGGRVLSP